MRGVNRTQLILRDAAVIFIGCAVVSLLFNALRDSGLPVIRREAYAVLVPCPETMGEAKTLSPAAALFQDKNILLIDARSPSDFQKWHVPNSINVPYDYLEETPVSAVEKIAASGAAQAVVFGDGAAPDSGEQLAKELSGRGIRNVGFLIGGEAAVKAVLSPRGVPE